MVVLINGAFGIGKSTVASLVTKRLPGSAVFNPELPGIVLQRARRLAGNPVEDFQDIALWRRLVVRGIRATTFIRATVIVPMAFSNLDYLKEVLDGVRRFDPSVVHFCLVAPLEVVEERLMGRGHHGGDPRSAWLDRRAAECCAIHSDPAFAEQIPTAGLTAPQVADVLVERLETLLRKA